MVVGLIGVFGPLVPDRHTVREVGIIRCTVLIRQLLRNDKIVRCSVQHISGRSYRLLQTVNRVVLHHLSGLFSEDQDAVLSGGAGQGKAARCLSENAVFIRPLSQCKHRALQIHLVVVLVHLDDLQAGIGRHAYGSAHCVPEVFV